MTYGLLMVNYGSFAIALEAEKERITEDNALRITEDDQVRIIE